MEKIILASEFDDMMENINDYDYSNLEELDDGLEDNRDYKIIYYTNGKLKFSDAYYHIYNDEIVTFASKINIHSNHGLINFKDKLVKLKKGNKYILNISRDEDDTIISIYITNKGLCWTNNIDDIAYNIECDDILTSSDNIELYNNFFYKDNYDKYVTITVEEID